jgi:hypothetical protein
MLPLTALAGHGVAGLVGGVARDVSTLVGRALEGDDDPEALRRLSDLQQRREEAKRRGDKEEERLRDIIRAEIERLRRSRW